MERILTGLAPYVAPLCPVGHLPLKGGDQLSSTPSAIIGIAEWAEGLKLLISPLEEEMSGRTEGGNVEHGMCQVAA